MFTVTFIFQIKCTIKLRSKFSSHISLFLFNKNVKLQINISNFVKNKVKPITYDLFIQILEHLFLSVTFVSEVAVKHPKMV